MSKILKILVLPIILALTVEIFSLLYPFSTPNQCTKVAVAHAEQVGTLHVIISPQEAIDDGAKWRVDGGPWRDSGGYVGVEVGDYTIEFKPITCWHTPPNETISINEGQITEVTGTYIRISDLKVTIEPQGAIDAGAQWNVDGGAWQASGASVKELSLGIHTVDYKSVDGWNTPDSEAVNVSDCEITETAGTYTLSRALKVILMPQDAIDAGAQWNIDGGPWQDSGITISGLSLGEHTVGYKPVFGWDSPPIEAVSIIDGAPPLEITRAYIQQFGDLRVTILPQAVIDAGAKWRIEGVEWQDSGATVSGLSIGDRIVTYKGVFGWTAPPDEAVTINDGQTTDVTRSYTELSGSTFTVPTEYPTIQAAIDAASDGDTVLVADGSYYGLGNKNLDFNGKAIKVVSENGPESCIIDCEGEGRGFYFHNAEHHDSVVSGFTITKGFMQGVSSGGGGIRCSESSFATIINCIIKGNSVVGENGRCDKYGNCTGGGPGSGGGVFCSEDCDIIDCDISANSAKGGASANGDLGRGGIFCSGFSTIINSTITSNSAIGGNGIWGSNNGGYAKGGGIYIYSVSPTITNCSISNNSLQSEYYSTGGGGIYCDSSSPIITNSTIINHHDVDYGGGIYCDSSSPNITDCIIHQNMAINGGGLFCDYSSCPNIGRCTITGNTAESVGGGISCRYSSSPTLTNCTITGNKANLTWGGSAVHCSTYSSPTITNCTISDNMAHYDEGSSIYCVSYSSPTITNCILWGDFPREVHIERDSYPIITYSDIQGGYEGEGNIDADPLFVDPATGDFHLQTASPCIDAGDNNAPDLPATDKNGNPRIMDGAVNMGAYEYPGIIPPVAAFSGDPTSGIAPLEVNFTDQSTGTIISWVWDFGDGRNSVEENPFYIYDNPGTYTVSLTVTGPGGEDNTLTKADYITVSEGGWLSTYDELFNDPSDLERLRLYRDQVIAKEANGKLYTTLLYQNSEEAVEVLLSNPQLINKANQLIEANEDAISAVLEGRDGTIYNTREIATFLTEFARNAPEDLKLLAIAVKKQMLRKQRQGERFLGFWLE